MAFHELKLEIYKRGYNLHTFANKAGISYGTIRNICIGKKPSNSVVKLIAEGLNVTFNRALELCNRKENV